MKTELAEFCTRFSPGPDISKWIQGAAGQPDDAIKGLRRLEESMVELEGILVSKLHLGG